MNIKAELFFGWCDPDSVLYRMAYIFNTKFTIAREARPPVPPLYMSPEFS